MTLKTPLVDVAGLRSMLGAAGLAVIDCRFDLLHAEAGHRAFLAGHIPGARHADLDRDLSAPLGPHTGRHPLPAPEAFARRLQRLGIDNGTQVVVYDDANGSFAARLWWMLRWVGHDAVAVLDGGFQAWTASGAPLESGEPPALPNAPAAPAADANPRGTAPFTPRLQPDAVSITADIERSLNSAATLLVDARAPERFAGVVEPIDPVAGHIPGAVNHPFAQNLGPDGRFLPAALLRARWQERLAGRDPKALIAMCGSGVTACHNLLSLEVAGLRGATLYAGSWSEWIRDPARPIARGS